MARSDSPPVIVALSGGVDSAVAALLLQRAGLRVEGLHMTNWEDDGYCSAAQDFQDARKVCDALEIPLHRVNFARQYRERVFDDFLEQSRAGLTPNPDVLCNREIKFGLLKKYAARLGASALATGHYARVGESSGRIELLKGHDTAKDQSYFLHAVNEAALRDVRFPLGELCKSEVREIASAAGFEVAGKKDSTGICFIGERPFREFLRGYIPERPGPIETAAGQRVGTHPGLAYFTIGQRHGLDIGGRRGSSGDAWYVAEKRIADDTLVVVQGADHPTLYCDALTADALHWINGPPAEWIAGAELSCTAKTRYRQPDQACVLRARGNAVVDVHFEEAQRAITPGQYVVFYRGDRCLGGARIAVTRSAEQEHKPAAATAHG